MPPKRSKINQNASLLLWKAGNDTYTLLCCILTLILLGALWCFRDPGKILNGPFLRRIVFFIFNFFLIRNLTFGGVIVLTFFDQSNGFRDFQGWYCSKRQFSTPKLLLRSKNVRGMTPHSKITRFLMPIKVLESKKVKEGPPKWIKQFFSKTAHSIFYLKVKK